MLWPIRGLLRPRSSIEKDWAVLEGHRALLIAWGLGRQKQCAFAMRGKQQTSMTTVAVKARVGQFWTLSKDGKLVLRMIIKLPN